VMYFIAGGEVEIELPEQKVRLAWTFFRRNGGLAAANRSATVRAVSRTSLLGSTRTTCMS